MITKAYERKLEGLGAFEISNDMLKLAKHNIRHKKFLNAGRGNPNWINTQGRLAFCRLMEFGIAESRRTMDEKNLAGSIEAKGITERFNAFMDAGNETDAFIKRAMEYAISEYGLDSDELIAEMSNAIVGNNYPVPSRCLVNIEVILNHFVEDILYGGEKLAGETQIMPTEGGTAAIVYIFDSLRHNGLLNEGDQIAINTPIFTPYLQIPRLTNYRFAEINIEAKEELDWNVPEEEFDKLLDPNIKAFFLVNPSNPGAHALTQKDLDKIAEVVKKRPDLIIITDDVYGTFVNNFKTVYSVAPYNTLLVYSFSKLYGVTGWRIGLIAANRNNVFDHKLAQLPEEKLKELDSDYSTVTLEPRKLPFIERICADSRSIGLYHTSGLSTPQQAFMALLSLTHLITKQDDAYIRLCKDIVGRRYHDLCAGLSKPEDNSDGNSKYYCLIDVYAIAQRVYDADFAKYMKENFEQIDFLVRLANEEGVVLMEGLGFSASAGTLRVSQANLPDEAYTKIAQRVLKLLGEYHKKYEKSKSK